jgi:predicted DNA binding CopG/RHH family protein
MVPREYRNRRQLDRRAAALIRSGQAQPQTREVIAARLAKNTQPVTLRLAVADIAARQNASRKGLGYQTYLKSLIHQALSRS